MSDIITAGDEHDFDIVYGDDWNPVFTMRQKNGDLVDLTGYGALLVVKVSDTAEADIVRLEDGDGITMGDAAGTVQPLIPKATTLAWKGVHDQLRFGFKLIDSLGFDDTKMSGWFHLSQKAST